MEAPNPVISRLVSTDIRLLAVIVHNNSDNQDPSRGVASPRSLNRDFTRICPAVIDLAAHLTGAIRCRGFTRGVAQLGSALRSGRRGRGFESRHPDSLVEMTEPPLTCIEGQGWRCFSA